MKKLSKILAVLLTVGLLLGLTVTQVFAATRTNNLVPGIESDYIENFNSDDFEDGEYTASHWANVQSFGDGGANSANWEVVGDSTNKYFQVTHNTAYTNTNKNNAQVQYRPADWTTSGTRLFDHDLTFDYDYVVTELDFGTDMYSYFDGTKYETLTPAELKEKGLTPDSEGVDLAFIDGLQIYPNARSVKDRSKNTYTDNRIDTNISFYTFKYDGKWYIDTAKTYNEATSIELDIGDYIHIAFIATCTRTLTPDGELETVTYKLFGLINGKLYKDTTVNSAARSLTMDIFSFTVPASVKNTDSYSICIDNVTTNYYRAGYVSDGYIGVDDFIKVIKTASPIDTYDVADMVYNDGYVANDYIEANGVKYYHPTAINECLAGITGKATISSNVTLRDVVVSEDLESLVIITDKKVTLDPSVKSHIIVPYEKNGVSGYEIRVPTEEDFYVLNWYNADGDLFSTTKHVFGAAVEPLIADYVDVEEGILYYAETTEWVISIGGEMIDLRALTTADVGPGAEVDVYLLSDMEEMDVAFFLGIFNEETKIVTPIKGKNGYTNYADAAKFIEEVSAAPSGTTAVLTSDISLPVNTQCNIAAHSKIYIDLNGHDLIRVGGLKTQPNATFVINEGTNFNIYSSRPGGRIFESSPYTATKEGTYDGVKQQLPTEDISYAAGGFICTNINKLVDACVVNVGAMRGFEANLEYNGGTLFYRQGKNYRDNGGDWNEFINDKPAVFNINGGEYYMPARPAYALATTTGPDVVFNFQNAKFYVSNASYALLHDYDDGRFSIKTQTSLINCEIISSNIDNIGKNIFYVNNGVGTPTVQGGANGTDALVYHTIGANSNVYIEDCKIVGKLFSAVKSGGQITLGGGNLINTSLNLAGYSYVKVADGITTIIPSADKSVQMTLSFAHPNFYADYDQYLVLDSASGKYVLKEGAFDGEDVVASITRALTFITIGDEVPSLIAGDVLPITWLDPDGNVYKTTFALKGDTVNVIEPGNFKTTELGNGWYDLGYGAWENATEGESADSLIAVAGKNNVFAPAKSLIADVEGTKAKLLLYHSQYQFFYYFPIPSAESGVIYDHTGSDEFKTGWYSTQNTANANPYYHKDYNKTEGNYYNNSFFVAIEAIENMERAIVFVVSEYDVNGDGVIAENEKNIRLQQNVDISIARYAELIINYYEHGSDEANLSYELMRFAKETRAEMKLTTSFFDSYEEAYFSKCNCEGAAQHKCDHVVDFNNLDLTDELNDISALTKYVYGANFNLNLSKSNLYIYLLPIDGEYSFAGNVDVYTKNGQNLVAGKRTLSFTRDSAKDIDVTLPGGSTVKVMAYKVNAMSLAWISGGYNLTVNVTFADGSTDSVSGVYSPADYVSHNPNVTVAKAFYAYAKAAYNYKVITSDEQ